MKHRLFPALIVGAALGVAAAPTHAVTCYQIIDRADNVVFRDSVSPVDLSEAGGRMRNAMRERGELLVIFDTDTCVVAGRLTGAGNRTLTVDEIIAEWRSNWGTNSYGRWAPTYDRSPAPAQSSAQSPAPAPAAPTAPASTPVGRAQKTSSY